MSYSHQPDTSIADDECQCSLIERCALCKRSGATTNAYVTDVDPICGCRKNRCGGCGVCRTCEGCYCGEDDRVGSPLRDVEWYSYRNGYDEDY